MREILFRGKHGDEWVEGYYLKSGNMAFIIIDSDMAGEYVKMKDIIPETVSEYTGLTDKNGKRIFEGDILTFVKGATRPFRVAWDGICWKMYWNDGKRVKYAFECDEIQYMQSSEVIGTIYDNPELLEEGEQ